MSMKTLWICLLYHLYKCNNLKISIITVLILLKKKLYKNIDSNYNYDKHIRS